MQGCRGTGNRVLSAKALLTIDELVKKRERETDRDLIISRFKRFPSSALI